MSNKSNHAILLGISMQWFLATQQNTASSYDILGRFIYRYYAATKNQSLKEELSLLLLIVHDFYMQVVNQQPTVLQHQAV